MSRKHPTNALLKDLKEVFDKHQWSGTAIGIKPMGISAADANECPHGKHPQQISIHLEDGTLVTKTVCL